METIILWVDAEQPDEVLIVRAAQAIRAGQPVAFPTETVYGLGADATNPVAVGRIFAAKDRPANDPLIVHIAAPEQITVVTGRDWDDLPAAARALAGAFWPGPLTLVLPKGPVIPANVTAGLNTVAVRLPAHPVARALITAAGVPLAAPSANRFGTTSPTAAHFVLEDLQGRIPLILDAGPCPVGIESTIVDVTVTPPRILRFGGVPAEQIEAVVRGPVERQERQHAAANHAAPAPGMLSSHYAPRAALLLFDGADPARLWAHIREIVAERAATGTHVGVLAPSEYAPGVRDAGALVVDLGPLGDDTTAARRLFAGLRGLDDAGAEIIIAAFAPGDGLGPALRDRLWRAAGGQVITVGGADGASS